LGSLWEDAQARNGASWLCERSSASARHFWR
jgi:hypothetical protein